MRFVKGNLERLAVESAAVREMDRRAIEDYGIPGAVLMENAGQAAAEVAAQMASGKGGVLILAGAGNNAGDGFVTARILANRGFDVSVTISVDAGEYKGDAATHFRIIEKMGLPITKWRKDRPPGAREDGLVVDALLGTGLKGDLRPPYPAMIDFANSSGAPVLAVDIPSGLDGDTGQVHTAAVRAAVTVTFALPKKGLFVGRGPEFSGEVILADIGMPKDVYPAGKALGGL